MIVLTTITGLLELRPVQHALVAVVLSSATMPIAGVFIVGLDIMTVRFAMMHVALLGLALGLWSGLDPMLCALMLCALAGGLLAPLAGRANGLSGPMGFLMTIAIATALLTLSITGVNATGAFSLLWGSILATRLREIVLIAVVGAAMLALYATQRRHLALLLYDREVALCSDVPVGILTCVVLVAVALAIGAAIRLTGALLVDAVTLLPALAGRNMSVSLHGMVWWAIGFGLLGNVAGFLLALQLDQPPGPMLVLTTGALTLLTYIKGRRA